MKPRSYKDLVLWRKAIDLAKSIHQITADFPAQEGFGITAQMRRAAISISSKIAEAQARRTTGESLQCLSHARGSAAELGRVQSLLATPYSPIPQ